MKLEPEHEQEQELELVPRICVYMECWNSGAGKFVATTLQPIYDAPLSMELTAKLASPTSIDKLLPKMFTSSFCATADSFARLNSITSVLHLDPTRSGTLPVDVSADVLRKFNWVCSNATQKKVFTMTYAFLDELKRVGYEHAHRESMRLFVRAVKNARKLLLGHTSKTEIRLVYWFYANLKDQVEENKVEEQTEEAEDDETLNNDDDDTLNDEETQNWETQIAVEEKEVEVLEGQVEEQEKEEQVFAPPPPPPFEEEEEEKEQESNSSTPPPPLEDDCGDTDSELGVPLPPSFPAPSDDEEEEEEQEQEEEGSEQEEEEEEYYYYYYYYEDDEDEESEKEDEEEEGDEYYYYYAEDDAEDSEEEEASEKDASEKEEEEHFYYEPAESTTEADLQKQMDELEDQMDELDQIIAELHREQQTSLKPPPLPPTPPTPKKRMVRFEESDSDTSTSSSFSDASSFTDNSSSDDEATCEYEPCPTIELDDLLEELLDVEPEDAGQEDGKEKEERNDQDGLAKLLECYPLSDGDEEQVQIDDVIVENTTAEYDNTAALIECGLLDAPVDFVGCEEAKEEEEEEEEEGQYIYMELLDEVEQEEEEKEEEDVLEEEEVLEEKVNESCSCSCLVPAFFTNALLPPMLPCPRLPLSSATFALFGSTSLFNAFYEQQFPRHEVSDVAIDPTCTKVVCENDQVFQLERGSVLLQSYSYIRRLSTSVNNQLVAVNNYPQLGAHPFKDVLNQLIFFLRTETDALVFLECNNTSWVDAKRQNIFWGAPVHYVVFTLPKTMEERENVKWALWTCARERFIQDEKQARQYYARLHSQFLDSWTQQNKFLVVPMDARFLFGEHSEDLEPFLV